MLKIKFLFILMFLVFYSFSQNITYDKNYVTGEKCTAVKSGKSKFSLYYNDVEVAKGEKKIKGRTEVGNFFFAEVKKKLLTLHPGDQSNVIDWAEKFSQNAIQIFFSLNEKNIILETLEISERYFINKILTNDKEFVYFLKDSENPPTNILYKVSGAYKFDVTALAASPDIAVIIKNLQQIVNFMGKQKDVSIPKISIVQIGQAFQLKIENTDGSLNYLSITPNQAEALKGDRVSEKDGQIIFQLKKEIPDSSGTQDDNPKNTEQAKETMQDKLVAKKDLSLSARNYTMELWMKNENYYLGLCGSMIDTVITAGKKENKVIKEDTCLKSEDKISKLDDNETSFKQMANNVIKRINKNIDTEKDQDYGKSIELTYMYFKGELSVKKALEKNEKFISDIKNQSGLMDIAAEKDTSVQVGTISLKKDSMVTIYNGDGSHLIQTKIDSVIFSIEDGKLMRRAIFVATEDGNFFNKDAPIPVLGMRDRANDKLVNEDKSSDTYIKLGDVFASSRKRYVPDDIEDVALTQKKKSVNLNASSNLNSIVNFSVYTDLAGLVGRRANGLLISDVTGKFITNTSNFFNTDATPLSYIEANVTISKFDSKFKSIDSTSVMVGKNGGKDTIDRMQLIQTAWLKGSVKFNLLSAHFFSSQYLHINIGTRINVVNADSFYRKVSDIIFFDYYPELIYSINRLKNFGMDLSLRWLQQRVADKEKFSNIGWQSIFNPQIAFFYYPGSNPNKKIYLRFNYFANHDKTANNFYQLQFGWKTGLKL